MKLGIARRGEFFIVVGFLKSSALGEGTNSDKSYRDFKKGAVHERPCFN
jgi:hypothetical protein